MTADLQSVNYHTVEMVTAVEALVDGGTQRTVRSVDWKAPVSPQYCVRGRCKSMAVDGHGFCQPCLLWLQEKSDDDPLDDGPELAKLQTPPSMWGRGDGPPYTNHVRERGAP